MLTNAAEATREFSRIAGIGVHSPTELKQMGCTRSTLTARLAAGRWQRIGNAIVLHGGELTREQRWAVGVVNCGPRAVLASFSAAESLGLTRWERDEVHVLAPTGVPHPRYRGLPIVLHHSAVRENDIIAARRCQRIAPALVLAAAGLARPRFACAILAAGVQQRLTTAPSLQALLARSPRVRHRRHLVAAINDIEMGAQALSEIDFVRLCRKYHLPAPIHQAVRIEPNGQRRYLDAEWRRVRDGQRIAAEVDGAIHLAADRWGGDQLRQNEVVIGGTLVLRFPTVVLRRRATGRRPTAANLDLADPTRIVLTRHGVSELSETSREGSTADGTVRC